MELLVKKRKRSTATAQCGYCGREYERRIDTPRQRFCSHLCGTRHRALLLRGENHPTYKGRVRRGRYIGIFMPNHPLANSDGYVLEHRLRLHEAGVPIPFGHHVHHRNGNRADNQIENLEVIVASEHHRQHIQQAGVVRNQHGSWPLLTPEQREKKRRYGKRSVYRPAE